jgi:hypothetical protein
MEFGDATEANDMSRRARPIHAFNSRGVPWIALGSAPGIGPGEPRSVQLALKVLF